MQKLIQILVTWQVPMYFLIVLAALLTARANNSFVCMLKILAFYYVIFKALFPCIIFNLP